jgi:DNA (cytosine-5)-methyltransferase 1
MQFKLGELFCGPGGLALGANLATASTDSEKFFIQHQWANDIDADACETYRRNICPESPDIVFEGKVEELDIESLPPIDAFAYGFPCNDFSIVGEHKGMEGEFGPLYSYGVEVLDIHRPIWFFAENVGGIANANNGEAFKIILSRLASAGDGYKLYPHLYKFEDYGIPQTRHRIIVIGINKNYDVEYKVPDPGLYRTQSARTAIEVPPIPDDALNNELTNHPRHVIERLDAIPPGKNAWWPGLPKHLRLNVKKARLSQIYKRLAPDAPAYTVTGSGGGGTHVYHWEEPRALTNRERARLQTFPDDFVFYGGKESVRKQIGMAVPPKGAKIILEAVLKTFAGIEYPHVDSKWNESDFLGG